MRQAYINDRIEPPIIHNANYGMNLQRWTPDRELTLTKIPNTIIKCRLCRGSKFVVARHMDNRGNKINLGDLVPCPNCEATGLQKSTHIDELWGMRR